MWWESLQNLLLIRRLLPRWSGAGAFRGPTVDVPPPSEDHETVTTPLEILSHESTTSVNQTTFLTTVTPALFARLARTHNLKDIENAITATREAISVLPAMDGRDAALLYTLAELLLCRFELSGRLTDVKEALSLHHRALLLRPPGHADRYLHVLSLAKTLHTHFCCAGEFQDLADAIENGCLALSLFDPTCYDQPAFLTAVAEVMLSSFKQTGLSSELDQCIEYAGEAASCCSPESPARPASLVILSRSLLSRYEQRGESADLEAAIGHAQEAIPLCPAGHPDRPRTLATAAAGLLARYERTGQPEDLEQSVVLSNEALPLCSRTTPVRLVVFDTLVPAFIALFTEHSENSEHILKASIKYSNDALTLCPPRCPNRPSLLVNFAVAKWTRFLFAGKREDIEGSVTPLRDAIELLPLRSTMRVVALSRLADVLYYRFMSYGVPEDLEESVALGMEALSACGPSAPSRAVIFTSMASSLGRRFNCAKEGVDLVLSTEYFQQGLACCRTGAPAHLKLFIRFMTFFLDTLLPAGLRDQLHLLAVLEQRVLDNSSSKNLHYPSLLGVLASVTLVRYEESENPEDLEKVFTFAQEALSLCPPGAIIRPELLLGLANALDTRFGRDRESNDLTQCVESAHVALALCSPEHRDPRRLKILRQLGKFSNNHFALTEDPEHLSKSIDYFRDALTVCPSESPAHPLLMVDLAAALDSRFSHTKQIGDVEEAIDHYQQALLSHPPTHSKHHALLGAIAFSSRARFLTTGSFEDLETLIGHSQKALASRSFETPEPVPAFYSTVISVLAYALKERHRMKGRREDLEKSIEYSHEALALCPPSHPARMDFVDTLASALRRRFRADGRVEDLNSEVMIWRESLRTAPDSVKLPLRLNSILTLANALKARFDQTHQFDDLRDAVQYGYDALSLCPKEHPRRLAILAFLSASLAGRFNETGGLWLEDLASGISLLREALSLDQTLEHRAQLLAALTEHQGARFQQTKDPEDFEKCMQYGQEALRLCSPEPHGLRPHIIHRFALCCQRRYDVAGDPEDLRRATSYFKELEALFPSEDPAHLAVSDLRFAVPGMQYNVSWTLDSEDLDKRIDQGCQRLSGHPPGQNHPERQMLLNQVACFLFQRYGRTGKEEDILNAVSYAKESALSEPRHRMKLLFVTFWAFLGHVCNHPSTLEAYRLYVELSERMLATAPTLEMQHNVARKVLNGFLPLDLAAYAIGQGDLKLAVEIIEQGRALLWSQIRRLRTPLDKLAADEKLRPLRNAFLEKSRALEAIGTSANPFLSSLATEEANDPYGTMLEMRRRLSADLDEIIEQIRIHFPDFLRSPSYDKLKSVSGDGPVVVVNNSVFRSDALILGPGDNLSCVKLSSEFYNRVIELSNKLLDARQVLKHSAQKEYDRVLRLTLKVLGELLVGPVVEKLKELGVKEGSRIWWCPTSVLSALPLHAAGPLTLPELKSSKAKVYLPDLYISSYTPTLAALIEARTKTAFSGPVEREGLLGVAVLDKSLEAVDAEVDVLRACFSKDKLTLAFEGGCDRNAVIAGLAERSWVHLACHGTLKEGEPFNSAFMLSGDERLTLLDIIKAGLHNAELAVLSACHTAEQTPGSAVEEVLHLAAAMQFSGFRSVVGTMWQMQDEDGPTFAKYFYHALFKEGGGEDISNASEFGFKKAARALCSATKEMRRCKVDLERWVNYVHIGA
ncbi:uncharacterized protein PHACADRAFT_189744 [Phanerochaete carnosa HHB-10118-sp]|uniref:CHAT domain-containing protein n=1 Tax=Phanerochaete carnosa (strain HHB-10118-sp) TaxID=650164 RepID=K5WN23_PHACS|nr:uncharacterized protein PHACADRAFT_189744 [Phanerochaete carnosa HHB-10118-sp]EKM60619.1 hypothetical protein PHACADRAFT_189744 [Phanerochaete carnosa HHB-10118-sp]